MATRANVAIRDKGDSGKQLEREIEEARRDKAKADAERAKAEAEKAQQEVIHEKEKIAKTRAETSRTKKSDWFDGTKAFVALGGLALAVATFVIKEKKK